MAVVPTGCGSATSKQGIADTLDVAKSGVSRALRGGQTANGPQRDELPATMAVPRLNAEQRCALAMLATAGLNGATQSLLTAHGLGVSMIAALVNRGLATLTRWQARPAAR